MQFRSDPEFEEARINDLEDLVLQLQDRIEKLEKRPGDWIMETISRIESLERSVVQLRSLLTPTEAAIEEPGQQIAKAIKAME